MKLSLIAALALFSTLSFANEKSTETSKPLALPDFSNLQQPDKASAGGPKVSVDMNCQTNDGQNFKASEAGFDTCVANKTGKPQ